MIMKAFLFFALIFAAAASSFAQDWDPVLTEKWDPVPSVVTPGSGSAPPSDAIVLFDGTDFSEWEGTRGGEPGWRLDGNAMTVVGGTGGIQTRRGFGDIQLHIEWRTPEAVEGQGQGRGNSGIFFQEEYEIQVLDSYENVTYSNGQAGSIYKQHIPEVNASRAPGVWQAFDVVYEAPVFAEDGEIVRPAIVTAFHNGVLILNRVKLSGTTAFIGLPTYSPHGDRPLMIQDHGNPVSYRNIWVREL